MPSRNHNKVHGKHRGRSNFRPFTVTLYINTYSYSELSEEAKATAYKAWKPDYAFGADNHRTLEAFCTAFGIEVTEYVYEAYYHSFRWRAKNEGDEEITDNEYIDTACPSSSLPGFIWTT